MTAVRTPPPAAPAGPFGGLLRAEAHRFLARRFIRVLLLAAVAGWVIAGVLSLLAFESPSAERLDAARQQQQEEIQRSSAAREQCLVDPARPADVPVDEWCGPPVTEDTVPVSVFLQPAPFSLSGEATEAAVAV